MIEGEVGFGKYQLLNAAEGMAEVFVLDEGAVASTIL